MVGYKEGDMSHNTISTTDEGFQIILSSRSMLLPNHRTNLQRVIENTYSSGELTDDEYQQLSRVFFSPTSDNDVFRVGYATDCLQVTNDDLQFVTVNALSTEVDTSKYRHPTLAPRELIRISVPTREYVYKNGEISHDDVSYLRRLQNQIEKNKIIWNKAKNGDSDTLEYNTPQTYKESKEMIGRNKIYQEKIETLWKELTNVSYVSLMATKVGHQHSALEWDIEPQDVALVDLIDYYADEHVCKRCGAVGNEEFVNTDFDGVSYQMCEVCQPAD